MTHIMDNLTDEQKDIIVKVLLSDTVKLTIGSEDWDLTEPEEMELWKIRDAIELNGDAHVT